MSAIPVPAKIPNAPHEITLADRLRASIKRVPAVEEAEESAESYEATATLLTDRKRS